MDFSKNHWPVTEKILQDGVSTKIPQLTWVYKKAQAFTAADALPAGTVLIQKDYLRVDQSVAKAFSVISLQDLAAICAKSRQERLRHDLASLHYSIEAGMPLKFLCDLEDRQATGMTSGVFQAHVASILAKIKALLPKSAFSVHICEGQKQSAHIHAIMGEYATIDMWKHFVNQRVLPALTTEEADLVFDPCVYRVGAFRMPDMTKKGADRFLSPTPSPMSDKQAFELSWLELHLRVNPLVLFPGDSDLGFTPAVDTAYGSLHEIRARVTAKPIIAIDSLPPFVQEAITFIKQTYQVSSISSAEAVYYVSLDKTLAARTCPLSEEGHVHRSNTLGFCINAVNHTVYCFCRKGCTNAAGQKSVRFVQHKDGTFVTQMPINPRLLPWLFSKTGVEWSGSDLDKEHSGFVYNNGVLYKDRKVVSHFAVDMIQPKPKEWAADANVYSSPEQKLVTTTESHTIAVAAGYGMGKTTRTLQQCFPKYMPWEGTFVAGEHETQPLFRENEHETVAILTYRKTLASQLMCTLRDAGVDDFKLYWDMIPGEQPSRVIVQLDSIERIAYMQRVDLVILDEYCSLLAHIQASTLHGSRGARVYMALESIVRRAKHVVALDADLSPDNLKWLHMIRGTVEIHANEHKSLSNRTCVLVNDSDRFLELIYDALGAGKRIAVPCTSKRFAVSLNEILTDKFPGKTIRLYTGDTDDMVKNADFRDVDMAWSSADATLYTSCCEAGVSFNLIHFDLIFAYAASGGTWPRGFLQQLHRVRRLKEDRLVLLFAKQAWQLEEPRQEPATVLKLIEISEFLTAHDIDPVFSPGDLTLDGKWVYSQSQQPYLQVFQMHVTELINSRNHFAHEVLAGLKQHGYTISHDSGIARTPFETQTQLAKSLKATKEQEVNCICKARELTLDEAEKIRKRRLMSEEDKYALRKFALRMAFNFHEHAITPEWYETYSGLEGVYRRLCQICPNERETGQQRLEFIKSDAKLDIHAADAFTAVRQTKQRAAFLHQACEFMLDTLGFEDVFDKRTVARSKIESGVKVLTKWLCQPVAPGHGSETREEFIAHLYFSRPCRRKQEWTLKSLLLFANGVLKHAYAAHIACTVSGGRASVNAPYKIAGVSELWRLSTDVKAADQTDQRPFVSSQPATSSFMEQGCIK